MREALESALNEAKKVTQPGGMDVHTGQFSLQPRYGRDGKMTGWQGSTELVLEGKDFARIGATVSAFLDTSFQLKAMANAQTDAPMQSTLAELGQRMAGSGLQGRMALVQGRLHQFVMVPVRADM